MYSDKIEQPIWMRIFDNIKHFHATHLKFWDMFFFSLIYLFFLLGFTPCKTEQPLQGMELQEKETQKN